MHFEILVSCSDKERNFVQAHETSCKLKKLHAILQLKNVVALWIDVLRQLTMAWFLFVIACITLITVDNFLSNHISQCKSHEIK